MKARLDVIGLSGLLITAIVSPCCFPLFGITLAALGFGSFELFGDWTMWIFQGLVILSLIGAFFTFKKNKRRLPILISIASGLLIFIGYYWAAGDYYSLFIYTGMLGLIIAGILNFKYFRMQANPGLEMSSIIKCPTCGHEKKENMPEDACRYFYQCEHCKVDLKPLSGDCCVFCSYGTVKCPPMQKGANCCTN